jgi:hypothetical protein
MAAKKPSKPKKTAKSDVQPDDTDGMIRYVIQELRYMRTEILEELQWLRNNVGKRVKQDPDDEEDIDDPYEEEEDCTDHYVIVQTRRGPNRKDVPYQMYYYGKVDKHPDEDDKEGDVAETWGPDLDQAVQFKMHESATETLKYLGGCEAKFKGSKYLFKYNEPQVIGIVDGVNN